MKIMNLLFLLMTLSLACTCVASQVEFEDVTLGSGLQGIGNGGATWADLDNDGWVDLISSGKIWKNVEGTNFVNITEGSGISSARGACVVADFNGDGEKDIYFFASAGGKLYLGQGNLKFTKGEAFKNEAQATLAACVADLNNDGYVDVYVANYEIWKKQLGFHDIILRNDKGSLVEQWKASDKELMRGRGATSCDFNNDGLMDVYVSNYRLMPNFLWINHGDWSISDEASEYGCAGGERENIGLKNSLQNPYLCSGHTIGSLWADFNNDTYFDLFVGNFSHPPKYQDRPMLLKNGGPAKKYHFIDKSALAKITWQESYASPAAADVDNDGFVDIFFTTVYEGDTGRLFRNLGSWKFNDITLPSNIKESHSYQNAFADFDNDGRIDLITSGRLYRNVSDIGNWLEVNLVGKAPNTSAIGAKVIIDCHGSQYIRQVEAGTGQGNQNDLRLHFGVGKYIGQIKAQVIWPNGKITKHMCKANSTVSFKQE